MSLRANRPKSGTHPENSDKVVPAFVPASRIKRKLREHLRELGWGRAGEWLLLDTFKEHYRTLHVRHWAQRLDSSISRWWSDVGRAYVQSSEPCLSGTYTAGASQTVEVPKQIEAKCKSAK
jgi:hypothetical protein